MTERQAALQDFLTQAKWGAAVVGWLAGDASNRRYARLRLEAHSAMLMDADPAKGEDVRPFIAVTHWLRGRGLSAPAIMAADEVRGFLLLEDLGDDLYARLCARDVTLEQPLYAAAVDLLHELHLADPADALMNGHGPALYDAAVLRREAALVTDWYLPAASGQTVSDDLRAEYLALVDAACARVATVRTAYVLRDYHAENLMWLPKRSPRAAQVGLLDYQDALIGHPAYDLVSLLEDARRDLSPGLAQAMLARYAARAGTGAEFLADYAVLGAQRNLKIIGIFARLCRRDGKPRYLTLLPRVWAHLQHDLAHPALAPLRDFVARHLPVPTPAVCQRIQGDR